MMLVVALGSAQVAHAQAPLPAEVRGGFFEQDRAKSGLFTPAQQVVTSGNQNLPRVEESSVQMSGDSFAVKDKPKTEIMPAVPQFEVDSDRVTEGASSSRDEMREELRRQIATPETRKGLAAALGDSQKLRDKLEAIRAKSRNPDGSIAADKIQEAVEEIEKVLKPKEEPEVEEDSHRF